MWTVGAQAVPKSLVWATDYDVLPIDHVVEPRDGYLVVRSPGNPSAIAALASASYASSAISNADQRKLAMLA